MEREILEINIKNMVCPRCISAVENVMTQLNIAFKKVELGVVSIDHALEIEQKQKLESALSKIGFEMLETNKSILISKIKTILIEKIHHSDTSMNQNYSTFISEYLNHDYAYLSRLFSSVEGITIEKFITKQKIEKVKELLFYNELSLSEISYKMNYSSVAYLSSQFKKETGMTTTVFKANLKPNLKSLDSI